jgi:hypothetical protein
MPKIIIKLVFKSKKGIKSSFKIIFKGSFDKIKKIN